MANYTPTGDLSTKTEFDSEFSKVQTAINSQLDRNPAEGQSNAMQADLDMNGNKVLNVPAPVSSTDLVRAIDLGTISAGASTNVGSLGLVSSVLGTEGQAIFSVAERALFVVQADDYVALEGDITLANDSVAALQPSVNTEWNVLWFGAISDLTGTIDNTDAFNSAATRAGTDGVVLIPDGGFKVLEAITQPVLWKLQPGTEIYGIGGVSPSFERDLSYLTGSVIKLNTESSWNTIRVGDSGYEVQKLTKKSFSSEIEGHSDNAAGGVLGTTYASARTTVDASRHALTGVAVNDVDDNTGVWAAYFEAYVLDNTDGNSFCIESTTFNANSSIDVVDTPNLTVVGRQGLTYNLWLTTGGDSSFGETMYDSTAAIGILGKEGTYGAKYDKGIICKHDSIDSDEFCAIPAGLQYTWWSDEDDGDGDKKRAYIEGVVPSADGQLTFATWNDTSEVFTGVVQTPSQFSPTDNTLNLGAADRRWKEVFSVNGTINTSDETQKEQIASLSATEQTVALACKALIKKFKWKDAVLEKGSDARIHTGVISQEIQQAFDDEGLDASDYGLFTLDVDDEGNEIYGVRYTELLCFIIGAM